MGLPVFSPTSSAVEMSSSRVISMGEACSCGDIVNLARLGGTASGMVTQRIDPGYRGIAGRLGASV